MQMTIPCPKLENVFVTLSNQNVSLCTKDGKVRWSILLGSVDLADFPLKSLSWSSDGYSIILHFEDGGGSAIINRESGRLIKHHSIVLDVIGDLIVFQDHATYHNKRVFALDEHGMRLPFKKNRPCYFEQDNSKDNALIRQLEDMIKTILAEFDKEMLINFYATGDLSLYNQLTEIVTQLGIKSKEMRFEMLLNQVQHCPEKITLVERWDSLLIWLKTLINSSVDEFLADRSILRLNQILNYTDLTLIEVKSLKLVKRPLVDQ